MDTKARQVLDLLEAIGPSLYGLLGRLTLRRDVAEELMQDLFLKLYRSDRFAAIENKQAYAYRAAVRLAIDWRQARKNRPQPLSPDLEPATDPAISNQLADAEQVQRVLAVLEQMDEPYRYAFIMRWIHEQPYEAIAPHLGKTPHQVRGLCHRALQQLREWFAGKPTRSKREEDCHVEG